MIFKPQCYKRFSFGFRAFFFFINGAGSSSSSCHKRLQFTGDRINSYWTLTTVRYLVSTNSVHSGDVPVATDSVRSEPAALNSDPVLNCYTASTVEMALFSSLAVDGLRVWDCGSRIFRHGRMGQVSCRPQRDKTLRWAGIGQAGYAGSQSGGGHSPGGGCALAGWAGLS
ncbi:unnamed protein product [Calypogeia fissa]